MVYYIAIRIRIRIRMGGGRVGIKSVPGLGSISIINPQGVHNIAGGSRRHGGRVVRCTRDLVHRAGHRADSEGLGIATMPGNPRKRGSHGYC